MLFRSAPRPSSLRIARVLPPPDSASRAARATSLGPSAIFSVSSARVAPESDIDYRLLIPFLAHVMLIQTLILIVRITTSYRAIDLAKPAVTQARENYRLVKARAAQGDATATELTDAETALTRAEQDYLNSTYEYLTARARLDYVMGQTVGRNGR